MIVLGKGGTADRETADLKAAEKFQRIGLD
jgi:hypothetical protein